MSPSESETADRITQLEDLLEHAKRTNESLRELDGRMEWALGRALMSRWPLGPPPEEIGYLSTRSGLSSSKIHVAVDRAKLKPRGRGLPIEGGEDLTLGELAARCPP